MLFLQKRGDGSIFASAVKSKPKITKTKYVMSQFTDIINEKKPTLVDFHATWCGPCKMQGPIIEEVKAAVGDEANVLKIDVDRNPELAAQYRVQSVPTLIIFRSGEAVWRASGLHQKSDLVDEIRKHIATKSDEQ